jgi:hypothetical protein
MLRKALDIALSSLTQLDNLEGHHFRDRTLAVFHAHLDQRLFESFAHSLEVFRLEGKVPEQAVNSHAPPAVVLYSGPQVIGQLKARCSLRVWPFRPLRTVCRERSRRMAFIKLADAVFIPESGRWVAGLQCLPNVTNGQNLPGLQ